MGYGGVWFLERGYSFRSLAYRQLRVRRRVLVSDLIPHFITDITLVITDIPILITDKAK